MITIVNKETKVSHFCFADGDVFSLGNEQLEFDNPVSAICPYISKNTHEAVECTQPPSNYECEKYIFNGQWSLNPEHFSYVDPEASSEPE